MKNNYWEYLIQGYRKEKKNKVLDEIITWLLVISMALLFVYCLIY